MTTAHLDLLLLIVASERNNFVYICHLFLYVKDDICMMLIAV
jgi:hypothetical protein